MKRLLHSSVVAATLLLAACGGSGSKSSSSRPTGGATIPPQNAIPAACTLVTQADATKLFGYPATLQKPSNSTGADSACLWAAHSNADPNAIDDVAHLLNVFVYNDTLHYGEKFMTNVTKLRGIGDQAFTNVQGPLLQVEFVKGGRTVAIAYSITTIANPKPKAADHQAELVALARTAASRL